MSKEEEKKENKNDDDDENEKVSWYVAQQNKTANMIKKYNIGTLQIFISPEILSMTSKERKRIDKIYNLKNSINLDDLYEDIKENYLNIVNQVEMKIGNKYYPIVIEKIRTSPVYLEKVYYIESDNNEPSDEIIIYYI